MKRFGTIHHESNVTPLTQSINFGYPSDEMGKILGMKPIVFVAHYQKENVTLYVDIPYWKKVAKILQDRAKTNSSYYQKIFDIAEQKKKETLKIIQGINFQQIAELSNNELASLIKGLSWNGMLLSTWTQLGVIADHYHNFYSDSLHKILESKEHHRKLEVGEIMNILTTPIYEFPFDRSIKELFLLRSKIKSQPKMKDKLIEQYLSRWFWINFGQLGHGMNKQDIIKNLKKLSKPKSRKSIALKQNKLFKQLHFTPGEKRMFEVGRDFIYLKGMRMEVCHGICAFFDEVAKKIQAEVGIKKILVLYCTTKEVLDYLTTGKMVNKQELIRRRHSCVMIPKDVFRTKIFSGQKARQYLRNHTYSETTSLSVSNEVKGNVAFPGLVKGIVRIVNNPSEIKKIKKGDILVSIQTTPELLPAMKKVAAFVTDIGGIVSHAAIVSREMRIPCVVGTRVATKILKDGDKVEVDATHGLIKKI
jgi:phosphohistidine swiveling domain-containing protein